MYVMSRIDILYIKIQNICTMTRVSSQYYSSTTLTIIGSLSPDSYSYMPVTCRLHKLTLHQK